MWQATTGVYPSGFRVSALNVRRREHRWWARAGCVWALDHTLNLLEVPPASLLDLGSLVRSREACTAQERRGRMGRAFVGRQPHLCRAGQGSHGSLSS